MAFAFEKPILHVSKVATAVSLATKQYRALKLSGDNLAIASVAGEPVLGVLQNAPAASETATVMTLGITKAVAAGTIAAMERVSVDASGEFVKAVGGDYAVGMALESAVDNDVFTLHLGLGAGYIPRMLLASVFCDLALITGATIEPLTDMTIAGANFVVERFIAIVVEAVTTGSKLATFNLEKNATNLTGSLALTSANCTPLGKVIEVAVTDNADALFDVNDTLSIEAASVTAFAEGEVEFQIWGRPGR